MTEVIGIDRRRAVIELADRLNAIDRRLEAIARELREVQPVRPGALTLASYRCGKGCAGCPHPRWLQWSQARSADKIIHTSRALSALKKIFAVICDFT